MGNETVTVQNLKVFGTDTAENLIFVEGAVPGSNGTFVLVNDAVKKVQGQLPVPTFVEVKEEPAAATEEQPVNEAEQA
jgi:large subunit ribosomal protein L3